MKWLSIAGPNNLSGFVVGGDRVHLPNLEVLPDKRVAADKMCRQRYWQRVCRQIC